MYKKSLISFIDILGFKHLIDSSSYDDVAKKLETIRRLSAADEAILDEGFGPRVIQFSDSVIRIRPIDEGTPFGVLFSELNDLVHLQGELVMHGVFMRGGVAVGDVHADVNTIFGPGFVRAYEMESQHANFPRIVIDPEVLILLTDSKYVAEHHTVEDEVEYLRKQLQKDADGLFFVDYLRSFINELDHQEDAPRWIDRHKSNILAGYASTTRLNGVVAKYMWLANYHNRFVSKIPDDWFKRYDLARRDLLISYDEMPLNFDWPRQ